MSRETVTIDLDPKLARDISAGGVFVPGCKLPINSDCALVVRGPVEEIELEARVVYVDPKAGAGLELVGFTPAMREYLTRLMTAWTAPVPGIDWDAETLDMPADEPAGVTNTRARTMDMPGLDAAIAAATADPSAAPVAAPAAAPAAADDDEAPEPTAADQADPTEEEEPDPVKRKHAMNMAQRLRGLTLAQQIKHASSPDPQERIMLERFYGKNVWEALLRNPRLTPPEVARISRMGTLPRTMVEIIVGNGAWLHIPEVRRALLGNPRLSTDQILRVLRQMPKPEVKLASTMTVYPYAVRDAAKRLLKEG